MKPKQDLCDCLQPVAKNGHKRSKRVQSEQTEGSSTQKTALRLQMAMDMCGLTDSELFCELKRDTRCLMGWSDSTIVLAFRGTASMTNALSDLQVLSEDVQWRASVLFSECGICTTHCNCLIADTLVAIQESLPSNRLIVQGKCSRCIDTSWVFVSRAHSNVVHP